MISNFPLQYPSNYLRTEKPKPSQFKVSLAIARDELLIEIKRLGGSLPVISSNCVLRNDGLPYSKQPKITDCGVAVYFYFNENPVVLCCDKWNDIASNMRAINKTVEALRALDRWGVSEILKRTFTGFKALPERSSPPQYFDGISDFSEIQKLYRELVKKYHPDGSQPNKDKFFEVQQAFEAARISFSG